ncbi:MAG: flagellar basal body L-ring protein FlgH [Planctomycetota bacterium]
MKTSTTAFAAAAVLVALLAAPGAPAQSLHAKAAQRTTPRDLVSTLSARARGDILTIVISEQHKVKNEDKVDRTASSSLAARLESFDIKPDAFPAGLLPDFDVRSSKTQVGNAKQEKDSKVEAHVAVVVRDVLQNGVLVVTGKRVIKIDEEEKTLMISGLVNIQDISTSNTVPSDRVADAKVSITGEGTNTQYVEKGPVGRIIETAYWLVWPF